MTQNNNQTHRTILVPNSHQIQIADVAAYGAQTVIQQTQLTFTEPSPVTLTFSGTVNVGDTVNVLVQLDDDTVASVTDDVGNSYAQLTSGTFPGGQQYVVWTSPNVAVAPSGVIVTTTGGSDILAAILSEINIAA